MRYQAGRGFEMYRMGMEGVAAGVVNPCWNKEKENKWGTIGWRVDKTGQPCGDVENQWACEQALDAFVLGYKMDAFARGCTC